MRKQWSVNAALIVFFCVVGTFSSSLACPWCDPTATIPVLENFAQEARDTAEKSALLAQLVQKPANYSAKAQYVPHFLVNSQTFKSEPKNERFYTDYLCAFFPRAEAICDLIIPTMCSDALRGALASFVYFIARANWRYFVNSPSDILFERVHVEILLDQIKTVVNCLKRAEVDYITGLVSVPEDIMYMWGSTGMLGFYQQMGTPDQIYDLHALYLDFIVRLAYINVLHEDYTNSYMHYEQMQQGLKLLAGSQYEQTYTQVAGLYQELLKMMRQRLWHLESGHKPITSATSITLEKWLEQNKDTPELEAFVKSFISHYECNVTGKFTHEYHPFLLHKTATSLQELECKLTSNGLPQVGRLMLMGYEEQGVPRYYTNYSDAYFTDEMANKTNAGWSLKMFNRFGLLTGFLCKGANELSAYCEKKKGYTLPLTHINPDQVEIFDGLGTLFQEHAFGDAFGPVMYSYPRVENHLARMAMPQLCHELMMFWQTLYNNELKVSGKQHVVGTQDILFSIAYMRYLQSSPTPILHFYMGPDITYPIETSALHNKEVTRHAQSFVEKFMPKLQPINGKKTAYIFCSFVDGVGKSTMLGNVQNWMQHGNAVEKYEHVDNSSSQLATVFSFSDDVCIADLPAQVSHFTYKPDGYVYVDVGALVGTQEKDELVAYVEQNHHKLRDAHAALTRIVADRLATTGYDLAVFEAENPEMSFLANVQLLKKEHENEWISFTCKDKQYLYRWSDRSIRVRVALATAPSHGLKNTAPEQMIFTLGVRFPLSYQLFVDDLIKKLHEQGAEQVVMVDFLSMYSRSSRENVRVNYVIQQLALLNKDFEIGHSFYQPFVHNAQLLAYFEKRGKLKQFHTTLADETRIRTALYEVLLEQANTSIDALDLKTVTTMIQERLAAMPAQFLDTIPELVARKLRAEHAGLKEAYGKTREFVTIQQFEPKDLLKFSRKVCRLFAKRVLNEELNEVWGRLYDAAYIDAASVRQTDPGRFEAQLDTGQKVVGFGRFSIDCRDKQVLQPTIRQLRACWWAALSNLLYTTPREGKYFALDAERYLVPPIAVLPDKTGRVLYCVHPELDLIDKEYTMPDYSLFEVVPDTCAHHWGVDAEKMYLLDWSKVKGTHAGVYAFGHEARASKVNQYEDTFRTKPIVTNLYTAYAADYGDERVMVHEDLFAAMQDKIESLKSNFEKWQREAKSNGPLPHDVKPPGKKKQESWMGSNSNANTKLHHLRADQMEGARLFVRAVATLDMICKDVESDFASRRGQQQDFVANLRLTERITLPWLYAMLPCESLFYNYDDVEPLISWDYFEQ